MNVERLERQATITRAQTTENQSQVAPRRDRNYLCRGPGRVGELRGMAAQGEPSIIAAKRALGIRNQSNGRGGSDQYR